MKDKYTVIDSPCGSGKTHVIAAALREINKVHAGVKRKCNVCCITYRQGLAMALAKTFGLTSYIDITVGECNFYGYLSCVVQRCVKIQVV